MPYRDKRKDIEESKKRVALRRIQYNEYKASKPCADCGNNFPYYVMQFDHVKGIKRFELSRRSSTFGSKVFVAELEKCELVCSNCHAIRTYNRKSIIRL